MGRFQRLKIALEETQVWGLSREMSLERQLQLRPQALLLVGGDTPQRRPCSPTVAHTSLPGCLLEAAQKPSWTEDQLPSSDVLPGRFSGLGLLGAPVSCRGSGGLGDNVGTCLLKLGLDSRVLSLKEAGYVCGGPESTLSQTSPLIRKQKAFLWRRLNREPHGGGYPEPGWRIL